MSDPTVNTTPREIDQRYPDPAGAGIYRTGGVCLILVGVLYLAGATLSIILKSPAPSDSEPYVKALATSPVGFKTLFGLFALSDFLLLPAVLALYLALKHVSKSAMLIAAGVLLVFVVLDLVLTESNSLALITLNLKRFQADSKIDLKVDYRDPQRASKASQLLAGQHREAWLNWRNGQIARQWDQYAAILRQRRADLKLAVNLYTIMDEAKIQQPDRAPEDVDWYEEAREYGADARMLAKIPGVELLNTVLPGLYRWHRAFTPPFKPWDQHFRNTSFSPSVYQPFATTGAPFGVNLHDKYWEDSMGQKQGLAGMRAWGQRENPWRVSTPVPPAPHGLENYAEALGEADIVTMTKGGFAIGTVGLEEQVGPWAVAFRQLPAAPFNDLPGFDDPVRVRVCHRADGEWAYAQNRLPEPVDVHLKVASGAALQDLVSGQSLPVRDGVVTVHLSGYQLVSLWAPAGGAAVTGGSVSGTEATRARLQARLASLNPGEDAVAKTRLALLEQLMQQGKLTRAGQVLEEPWAERARSKGDKEPQ